MAQSDMDAVIAGSAPDGRLVWDRETAAVQAIINAIKAVAVTINAGDIEIGAVELKNGATDDRALIGAANSTPTFAVATLGGIANASAPSLTEAKANYLSLDLTGNLRAVLKAETTKVIGTVTINQGTDGTTNRIAAGTSAAIGDGVASVGALLYTPLGTNASAPMATMGLIFNGTTLDRMRGTAAAGLFISGPAADNAVSTGQPVIAGGVAVTGSSYAPAYTAGDAAQLAVDKDSGGLLTHNRALTRAGDFVSADPKQYSTVSTATPATADATVFTLAAGEKGFIQNLSADAPLAYKLGASASTSSFNGVLNCGSAADDGKGGNVVIDDYVGVVSVAKVSGTARYIAYKLS